MTNTWYTARWTETWKYPNGRKGGSKGMWVAVSVEGATVRAWDGSASKITLDQAKRYLKTERVNGKPVVMPDAELIWTHADYYRNSKGELILMGGSEWHTKWLSELYSWGQGGEVVVNEGTQGFWYRRAQA